MRHLPKRWEDNKKALSFLRFKAFLLVAIHMDMPILKQQYERSRIVEIKMYKCGFDMAFRVEDGCPSARDKSVRSLGAVEASLPTLERGRGVILWIKNGFIHSLEGYSYDEKLPEFPGQYVLE